MASETPNEIRQPFRPRARLLQLLGDELIGSPRLAVFELVKNAYDADATSVVVQLNLKSLQKPVITVEDDGEGMSLSTIQSVWLVPGDDHRQKQREAKRRSPKHNRLPLGEKGLGRFAVHKLGNQIELVTRSANELECIVAINWNDLIGQPYLDEAQVQVISRVPQVFKGEKTGTRITIKELRNVDWTRGEVRRLANQITSICSPFHDVGSFHADLQVPGHEDWIEGLPDVSEILSRAVWKFSFLLDNGKFEWSYEFLRILWFVGSSTPAKESIILVPAWYVPLASFSRWVELFHLTRSLNSIARKRAVL